MKKYMIVLAAIAIVLAATSGALASTLTPTVTATGTVIDTCNSPTNGTITFNIDPSGVATLTPQTTDAGNSSPSVKCTNGQTHAVACSSAHANKLTIGNDGITDPIVYTITGCATPLTGAGFTTATSITIGLSIPPANYQNAKIGAHSDIITVTVTY
ncbi:MAG TPA: hypothetical protein VL087_03790 [Nitrospirota bacterium]|nr:hypothetical protein [Nitrospirota bacterium]